MAVTGEVVRAYLEYLQDLGVYDLYRSAAQPDAAVEQQLTALLKRAREIPAAPPARAGAEPTARKRPVGPPPAVPPTIPLQNRRAGPSIVIDLPVPAQSAPIQLLAAEDDGPAAFSNPQAAEEMTPVGFNQLAPRPAASVAPPQKAAALQALRATIGDCTRCPLAYAGRHTIVFADGDPNAKLMFVGEGPGADEDASGLPFVGKAGQLLNNMIGAMGLQRNQVYIANIVMCRPPKNRVPEPVEANTCSNFLLQQIDIVQPQVIVALGSTAATYLLGVKQSLAALRGQWHDVRGAKCAVTYHPAYLLRDPRMKGEAWKDLQRVMVELDLHAPARRDPADTAPVS